MTVGQSAAYIGWLEWGVEIKSWRHESCSGQWKAETISTYDLTNVIRLRKYYFVRGFFCNYVNVAELRLIKLPF